MALNYATAGALNWSGHEGLEMKYMNNYFGFCRIFHAPDGAGSGGAAAAEGDESGADEGNDNGAKDAKPKTFDEILTDKAYQAEFDRRVNKALETARDKWQTLADDKASEAEKLAKMNKDEKAQYLHQKSVKALADREAAITKRELMAEAKNTLAEKSLPSTLAELLVYTDAEACNASIGVLEKAFQAAVESAVEDRLKGGDPIKKAGNGDKDLSDAESFIGVIKANQVKRV